VHINLTTEKTGYEKLCADTARKYIGGVGLAAKILWEDTLPPRLLTHKRGKGGAADSFRFLGLMLNKFYSYRGWSEEGIPTKEKLAELGLEQCLGPGL